LTDQSEQVRTDWRALTQLLPFVRPHALQFGLTVLYAIESVATRLLLPFLLQQMTDTVTGGSVTGLTRWAIFAAGMLILDAVAAWIGYNSVAKYVAGTIRDLRNRVTAHVQQLPISFLETQHSGDLVSRLSTDVGRIESWLPAVIQLVSQPLMFVAGFTYMLTISWKLLLASSILIPISAVLQNRASKPMETAAREQAEREGEATAALQDMLAGITMVKAYNLHSILGTKFRSLSKEIERQALKLDWRRAVGLAIFLALRYTPQLIVPLYGGFLAYRGEITVGQLLAANMAIWMVFQPIEQLLSILGQTRETLPAVERVFALLNETPEPAGRQRFEPILAAPAISLESVSFAYPGQDQTLTLQDISFEIQPGQIVAIVGPSGCGKSTLFKLLTGFHSPTSGTVNVLGNDLDTSDLTGARQKIALMAQQTYLFPTTIAENIAYGRPGATEDEVKAAAIAANAHDFILEQPEGYQTQVGERGAKLSGGERQRIALARAILKDAPVLLLDEPTSALDTQSETLVQEALERFMKGRTAMIVAHRLSTIQHADRVLVLGPVQKNTFAAGTEDDMRAEGASSKEGTRSTEGGPSTLREDGTHTELMAQDTLYRRLYLRQVAGEPATQGARQ